jgi:hypothetical protein
MFGGLAIQPVQTEKLRVKVKQPFLSSGDLFTPSSFYLVLVSRFFAVFANCLEFKVRVRACRIREI